MEINLSGVIIMFAMMISVMGISEGRLKVGFYRNTCPDAEAIVGDFVRDAARFNPQVPAFLLRLHFHDCFVQGCDGSILIDNGAISEKLAVGHQGVKGFDVIENAKAELEFVCPVCVCVGDLIPLYTLVFGFDRVLGQFMRWKLRLYNFMPGGGPDPSINPNFLPELIETCPPNVDINVRLPMDHDSGNTFDDHILQNIRNGFAVLQTDAKLLDDPTTKQIVDSYFRFSNQTVRPSFEADFVKSMVKMGRIGVETGPKRGEIRRVCNAFNN
ncbi:heme peroxidase [Cynara cardunculus var. scolymus]|uniref:peroxidase n=1 Tax=Cynara cardunculus var. scolymus TaxID=59895 RepID=A0A118JVR5_CYNCS|nr:heme peroxidase [Cynara cardunculus var. scolymus]